MFVKRARIHQCCLCTVHSTTLGLALRIASVVNAVAVLFVHALPLPENMAVVVVASVRATENLIHEAVYFCSGVGFFTAPSTPLTKPTLTLAV